MLKIIYNRQPARFMLALLIAVSLGLGAITAPAAAEESAATELSLPQAVAAALANSETVKSATKGIDKAQYSFDDANDAIDFIPASSTNAKIETTYSAMLQAQIAYNTSKKTLATTKEKIGISTTNEYWTILQNQQAVQVAELGVSNALTQLQNAQTGKRVGTIDDNTLISAQTNYKAAQATLASAQIDLTNAYIAFNQAVGLDADARPILTDTTVNYEPLEYDTPDYLVAKVLSESPSVWTTEQQISLTKILRGIDFYSSESTTNSMKVGDIKVEQAELDSAAIKKQTEQATRALFYSIKAQEDTYNKLVENINLLEDNLRVAQVKYSVGMATALDVATCQKSLDDAKLSLFELICGHEYSKLCLDKPWAA